MRISDWSSDVCSSDLIAHTTAADQDHRVLLKVVAFARNVADHFALIGEADLGHLAQRPVRLLRSCRINALADTELLRVMSHRRHLCLGLLRVAALAGQPVDLRHEPLPLLLPNNLPVTFPKTQNKNTKER